MAVSDPAIHFPNQVYINRELSWLEFNQRVLDQARLPAVPMLERLKFLAISASNLDEFFMVRVGSLQIQQEQHLAITDPSGLTAGEQLDSIYERVGRMIADQYACFLNEIEKGMTEEGLERIVMATAPARHQESAERYFNEEIYPVISPMAIDPDSPFPLLANLGLNLCVRLAAPKLDPPHRFAFIPLGKALSRFITLASDKGYRYALLEDISSSFVDRFFPGKKVEECVPFRITRNADVSVREDLASDLMSGMEMVLHQRRTADCVRLEILDTTSDATAEFLRKSLDLDQRDVVRVPGPLDLSNMMHLTTMEGFSAFRDKPWLPQPSPLIDPARSMFETIAERDVVLFHPYESFEPVVRLIEEAAVDPDVLAIKQILYRTSRKSQIVAALKRAAERGKYVTAVVELKARFDEARNIEWARELEQAHVQVIYGVRGLKTHAKICVIVRREPHGIQRYVHFGTGNYNETTARLYSDISYLTCKEDLGADASVFFNAITGYSQPQKFRLIEAAPIGLRKRLLMLIESETQRKRQGQRASITAKLNALVDPDIIAALYRASQAGVNIRLNVRGICCLRPGVPGISENIRVISIVDRNLEHARILCFHHGGDEEVLISSADWMPRNLDRRIELLVPIEDANMRRRLIDILDTYFRDNQNAWELQADGNYIRLKPDEGEPAWRSQKIFYEQAIGALKQADIARRSIFQPHFASSSRTS